MHFGEQMFSDFATQHCIAANTNSLMGRCNRVCNVAAITDQDIQEIKSYFGSTHFTWVVDSNDHSSQELFKNHGLNHKATSPGMIIDLQEIKDYNLPDSISIKEAESEQEFNTWIAITCKNYGYNPVELSKAIRFLMMRAQKNIKIYLGYFNGQPVASSLIAYHQDNLVSAHLVGTLTEYRSKGLGTAILSQPLLIARDQKYENAALMTSTMGLPLAKKLGFKEYATYIIYGNY